MNPTLILGVVVGVSAPTLKDPPKKESTIVGEWLIESTTMEGKPEQSHPSIRYEFTKDGQIIVRRDDARRKRSRRRLTRRPTRRRSPSARNRTP